MRPCNHARGMELYVSEMPRERATVHVYTDADTYGQAAADARNAGVRAGETKMSTMIHEKSRKALRSRDATELFFLRRREILRSRVDRNHERHSRARTGRNRLELIRVIISENRTSISTVRRACENDRLVRRKPRALALELLFLSCTTRPHI